jgi:tripartite-type tricarboxylate transporter receptor subunit TctC
LLGGQIELAVMALPSALPLLNSGKLKSFGLIRAQRDPMHKDLPSINEGKSIAGMDADLWIGLFAPKNTPPAVLKKLSDALQATLANSEFKAAQKKLGSSVPEGGSPASFARFLDGEEKKFQAIASTIKLD